MVIVFPSATVPISVGITMLPASALHTKDTPKLRLEISTSFRIMVADSALGVPSLPFPEPTISPIGILPPGTVATGGVAPANNAALFNTT